MKIGNLEFKNNIFLAPMAGVTDVGFRAIAKFFGAEMCYTEMVSAKGLIYGENKALKTPLNEQFVKEQPNLASNKSAWLLLSEPNEDKKAVQIFGNDPKFMSRVCQLPIIQSFDVIDINMGCPATKIIRNGEGSALMAEPEKAKAVIEACVKSTQKTITVKFRKGFKENNAVEFANMCEKAGASAICIHARLMAQGYGGKVDYSVVEAVKKTVKIPVIGSGDIVDVDTYNKMAETGVDGFLIGRASCGNQIIFKKLSDYIQMKKNKNFVPQKLVDYIQANDFFSNVLTKDDLIELDKNEEYIRYICAKKHIAILRKYYAEEFLVKYMRKHMLWYANGLKIKGDLKQKIALSDSLNDSLGWLRELII